MEFCSVAAGVDLAALRVTVDAVRRHHPGVPVTVLDVDGSLSATGLTLVSAHDLDIDDRALHLAAARLDRAALRAWLAPRLLAFCAARSGVAVHVAAGVRVLRPLGPLVAVAREHGLGLVARVPSTPPDDGRTPTPEDVRVAGPYLDTLVVAQPGAALDAWCASASPEAVPARMAALPAQSVASRWNVGRHSAVERGPAGLTLDGVECLAVDLTEFDVSKPWRLARTGQERARALLSEHPALRQLCEEHRAELLAADGRGVPADPFATSSDAVTIDDGVRRALADAGAAAPDPYVDGLTRWLDEPVSGGPLTRYLVALHRTRPDLAAAMPHVPGRDTGAYLRWLGRFGPLELPHATARIRAAVKSAPTVKHRPTAPARLRRHPRGVNVVGYLRGTLGVGESARQMVEALRAADVPYTTVPVDRNLRSTEATDAAHLLRSGAPYDVSLLCVNADQTGDVLAATPSASASEYRIGMWYWEVEDFPASMHGAFDLVDEVWTATDFVRAAVEPHATVPVITVTPPLPQRGTPTALSRADIGLPDDRFVFLTMFDYLSGEERKNPTGVVEAFRRAFRRGEGPLLVVKSINADQCTGDAERLRLRALDEPDVVLLEEYASVEVRDALVQHADAYVSLHRSEGLGLTIAEAMAWGKPAIATGYGGNLTFMSDADSYLVPWSATRVPDGAPPYPAGTRWADPDLDAAAAAMRAVVEHPDEAAARGARAAAALRTRFSPAASAVAVGERLATVRELTDTRWRRGLPRAIARSVRDAARAVRA